MSVEGACNFVWAQVGTSGFHIWKPKATITCAGVRTAALILGMAIACHPERELSSNFLF